MNHEDMLNDVITSMTSKEASLKDKVIEDIKSDEQLKEMIKIPSVLGMEYEVDPVEYNWDAAIENIPQILHNDETLNQYAASMFRIIGHEDEKEVIDFLNNAKNTFVEFLKGYDMETDIRQFAPDMTLFQEVMMLLYECNNVTKVMLSEIRNYGTIRMFSSLMGDGGIAMPEPEYGTEQMLDDEEYNEKMWSVTAVNGEGGIEITSVTEYDGNYELIDINSKHIDNNRYWTLVVAENKEAARRKGCEIFGCRNSEVSDIDDHVDSGLVS